MMLMKTIAAREDLTEITRLLRMTAPWVASQARSGQSVRIKVWPDSPLLSLPLVECDTTAGLITIVIQKETEVAKDLWELDVGDGVFKIEGPVGHPLEMEQYGTVVCVAIDWGIAVLRGLVRALAQAGNRIVSFVQVDTKAHLFWQEHFCYASAYSSVTTLDDSLGRGGHVGHQLAMWLLSGRLADLVVIVGPAAAVEPLQRLAESQGVRVVVISDGLEAPF